jgi:WD40 repeat protein
MRVFTLLFFFSFYILFAKEIVPYRYITASEAVSDFVKAGEILVIGTKEGIIDIYDLKNNTIIDKIVLEKQTNILGDEIGVLIPSVDYLNGKLVFVSRKLNTYGELYVYEKRKLIKILDTSEKITFEKIKFVDANRIIINTMGNELILFDIKKKKFLYRKQLNLASFSDFVLSEDKKYLYTADETPLINKIEINSGNIVEQYQQANKRDIFSVDYKNGLLLSGGKDSRVVLYKTPSEYKITMGEFFIYSVGLNPDATKAAFTKNENDEISVIDSKTLKELYLLKGHQTTIIKIDFYAPNELITADEGNRLMFWKLN